MATIQITTQAELDALPDSFPEYTIIELRGGVARDPLIVRKAWESSHVVALGSSHVEAWDSSHVVARESSHVVALGSSHVVAWGSSHVEAWDSSHVEAWESSHVVAWGSSHVEAWDLSHVEAWDSSHVVARDSSHVEAWGSVAVHNHGGDTSIELFAFAAAWLIAKAKTLKRHGDNTTVIEPKPGKGLDGWLEDNAVAPAKSKVVLFKRVSKDFQTQKGSENETLWKPGTTVTHPKWNPERAECGPGKFHACSRAYFCDEFRSGNGDRYVAIEIKLADLHAWENPEYPHKIAFREGKVLHECDRYGREVKS